ncbi:MAG: 50S ribosomal protein L18Ae, partial [Candidatus Hydrothermarchaeaceae archaeon]
YRVKGKFLMGEEMQAFTKEFRAISEEGVMEKIYTDLGSKHKVKRGKIKIEELKEIKPEEAEDPALKAMSGVG